MIEHIREVDLDPRTYQDLVDEARIRAGRACPEWTDHNVSDPGMTLIDQFAWMTDLLLYRVNELPERVHEQLLALIDVRRRPPTAARAMLRFRLAKPTTREPFVIPAGTEVATKAHDDSQVVVFAVSAEATVPVVRLGAFALARGDAFTTVLVPDGVARPQGLDQAAFSTPPAAGDALYLGFATSFDRLILRLNVVSTEARGSGVVPALPPVVWEAAVDGGWRKVERLSEGTGGFNYPSGTIELALPGNCVRETIGGRRMYWLRCRLVDSPEGGERYVAPPRIEEISVDAIGIDAPARHASLIGDEELGTSDGTPGQVFTVLNAPTLRLAPGERLEVSDREGLAWAEWERVDSFVDSGPSDHHFRFDPAKGEVQLGPAIRRPRRRRRADRRRGPGEAAAGAAPSPGEGADPDENSGLAPGWRQYGAVPPKGTRLRMAAYRHGGGAIGNVERRRLTVLRKSIAGVASVTNPRPARGGADVEPFEAARLRAADELSTRYRAVTARDFETIALDASADVVRARCVKPAAGEAVVVQVLPGSAGAPGPLDAELLTAPEELREEVRKVLEARCLIGVRAHVTPVALRLVTVAVEVQSDPASDPRRVEERLRNALHAYLNPVTGGDLHAVMDGRPESGPGWKWGRPLSDGELRPLIRSVSGVERILLLRIYETELGSGIPREPWLSGQLVLEPDELIASGAHVALAVPREGP